MDNPFVMEPVEARRLLSVSLGTPATGGGDGGTGMATSFNVSDSGDGSGTAWEPGNTNPGATEDYPTTTGGTVKPPKPFIPPGTTKDEIINSMPGGGVTTITTTDEVAIVVWEPNKHEFWPRIVVLQPNTVITIEVVPDADPEDDSNGGVIVRDIKHNPGDDPVDQGEASGVEPDDINI